MSKQNEKAGFAEAPCSVERTTRQVIEHKLLTSLDDSDKVAILATKQDLEDILIALEGAVWNGPDVHRRCKDLAAGMRQLLREAFPPNARTEPPASKP